MPDGVDAVPDGLRPGSAGDSYRRQLHLRDAAIARRVDHVPRRSAAGDPDYSCADGVTGEGVRVPKTSCAQFFDVTISEDVD